MAGSTTVRADDEQRRRRGDNPGPDYTRGDRGEGGEGGEGQAADLRAAMLAADDAVRRVLCAAELMTPTGDPGHEECAAAAGAHAWAAWSALYHTILLETAGDWGGVVDAIAEKTSAELHLAAWIARLRSHTAARRSYVRAGRLPDVPAGGG